MVDRRNKVGVRQGLTLIGGDGNEWHLAEAEIKGFEIAQILPAMKCSQGPSLQGAEKRKVNQIDMKMKNVELVRALSDLINQQHEVRNDVAHGRIKAKRTSATRSQLGAGDGVCARKERHIVAELQVLRSSRTRSVQCRHRDGEERSQ